MHFRVEPGGPFCGEATLPGDKSISHRAIMLGALATGRTEVQGFLQGADSLATLNAFRKMGVTISDPDAGDVVIEGVGLHGLKESTGALDLGNSGTSMRLLCGLLAGQSFSSTLTGDSSLSGRPMNRVAVPLRKMGAVIDTADNGRPPLTVHGGQSLHGLHYELPVASAQVKSSVLLAGLYANGDSSIDEPAPTRDHTERMLRTLGCNIETRALVDTEGQAAGKHQASRIILSGVDDLRAADIKVPADISSAAFFMVAASIVPGSDVLLPNVGVNPTRTGVVTILQQMGADIELANERLWGAEPVADIRIRSANLHGVDIPEPLVPLAIDEFPVLFIAALAASGRTVLRGAAELRVKESDRIAAMAQGIVALGGKAEATEDGMIIDGGDELHGGTVESHGDHRIAMAFAVAAMCASGPVSIRDCTNVGTSFPHFDKLAQQLGMNLTVIS